MLGNREGYGKTECSDKGTRHSDSFSSSSLVIVMCVKDINYLQGNRAYTAFLSLVCESTSFFKEGADHSFLIFFHNFSLQLRFSTLLPFENSVLSLFFSFPFFFFFFSFLFFSSLLLFLVFFIHCFFFFFFFFPLSLSFQL